MFKRQRSRLLTTVESLENGCEWLTRFPARIRRVSTHRQPRGWRRALHGLLRCLAVPIAFLAWIFLIPRHVRKKLTGNRLREFLFALPAMLVLGLTAVVLLRGYLNSENVVNKYRSVGSKALADQEFERAKIYFARIIAASENPKPQDRFNWFLALAHTGNQALAAKVLDELAPDEGVGLSQGHKFKAMTIVNGLANRTQNDPDILNKLKHHLENSQDTSSPEIHQSWATYYAKTEQTEKEIGALRKAAELDPAVLLPLANRLLNLGKHEESDAVLEQAVTQFGKRFKEDPLDSDSAITLAKAKVMLDDVDGAEQVLQKGFRIRPEPSIQQAIADIYVVRFDLAKDSPFAEKVSLLKKSIEFCPSSIEPYERMINLYRESVDQGQQQKLISTLQDQAVEGKTPAATHFALGNLLWMDGRHEKAKWHLEQAYLIDQRFAFISNNLAWLLAHEAESPDLDRALEVSTDVVGRFPDEPRFRDTLATILMKLGRLREASVEFERCLVTIRETSKKKIHQNLAHIYQLLGQVELAARHQQNAVSEITELSQPF